MSIRDVIKEWIASGDLCLVQPGIPESPRARWVFASKEVMSALTGPWPSRRDEVRLSRARADVDNFINGTLMSARMPPSRSAMAQIALLDPASNEVWEIRSRDPKPGVRIFSRFSERDHLIALTVAFREQLENDDDWLREIERCKREWRTLFPSYPPLSGAEIHVYGSNLVLV